eukprot:1158187-Pelagomonas_calceolata.AAC.5
MDNPPMPGLCPGQPPGSRARRSRCGSACVCCCSPSILQSGWRMCRHDDRIRPPPRAHLSLLLVLRHTSHLQYWYAQTVVHSSDSVLVACSFGRAGIPSYPRCAIQCQYCDGCEQAMVTQPFRRCGWFSR